jgi:XTP/dITP diphosphohydrolase
MIKANAAAAFSGLISVADDSGLEVNALGGEPGIYSARYAGEEHDDSANNEKLLSRLADKNDRSAAFVCCMACVFPKEFSEYGDDFTVFGKCEGEIIREYRGEGGFGYDPLFLVSAFGKTFAEMSADEKNAVSHRGKAVELLGRELCTRIKNKN